MTASQDSLATKTACLPDGFSLAFLTAESAPALYSVDTACFATPWSLASFTEALSQSGYTFLGAFDGEGTLVGYIGALAVLDEADITGVAVLPTLRRKGLADLLLAALIEEMKAKGIGVIHLEVREGNEAAKALYRKHGFMPVGKRARYYRLPTEDACLMSLCLRS